MYSGDSRQFDFDESFGGDGAIGFDFDIVFGFGGTTSKADENGNLLAKEVRVSADAADWPDFVFSETYDLKDLSEVETFIKKQTLSRYPKC